MKLRLLEELDPIKLARALSGYTFKKAAGGVNRETANLTSNSATVSQPYLSGNLETPVKPEHKGLMGQPDNPHGTMADKPGREPSITGSSRKPGETPTGILNKFVGPASAQTRPTETSVGSPDNISIDMGDPYSRVTDGYLPDPLHDAVESQPVDRNDRPTDFKQEGPAQDPGRVRSGSLGMGNLGFGKRYVG